VSFGQDGSISPADLEARYTSELANGYGNLASRTLAMIRQYRDGTVPEGAPATGLTSEFEGVAERVQTRFDGVEISAALEEIWKLVRLLNRYVQEEAPWQLAKDDAQAERLDSVLCGLAEGLRVVSVLLHPFMPEATGRLLEALGQEDVSIQAATLDGRTRGALVGELAPLFPRIEAREPA
jgi:methionyl-tRNA synthetase